MDTYMVYQHTKNEELMHTVQLPLKTTAYDCQVMEKRFHAVSHVHNVLVKHAKKCLVSLNHDSEYLSAKSEYCSLLKKNKLSADEKVLKRQLSVVMNTQIRQHGLSEYGFQSYIKVCAKQFRKCLSSQQVQKEATRVWKGVEKVLYGNGKDIHFKKYRDFTTICGKTNTNGAKFNKDTMTVEWLGLELKCRIPKDSLYITEALDADISYCEIKRMMFPNGWHYYVIVYLKDDAPHKLSEVGSPDNITGVDIGTSTVATVSDHMVTLQELAPECKRYNRRIEQLLRHLDLSRRTSNPGKYNPDGTINKSNRDRWIYTKTYLKNLNRLRSLYRQKAAYIKQCHEQMINELLPDSVNFIIEDITFNGLQRRTKSTERQDKTTGIVQKDGSIKQVHKFKRKKRFGRSLNDRAPASFVTILSRKAALYGGGVYNVQTKDFKASQYDHVEDNYKKAELKDRSKYIGGYKVQRDLYSAFLLKNSNTKLDKPDREKCIHGFENFLELQNNLICEMKKNNVTMKQCFGF